MRRQVVSALLLFVVTMSAGMAFGDQLATGSFAYSLSGTDIPRLQLIEAFFAFADAVCQDDEDFRDFFVQEVGLTPDSKSEEILMRAIERARALRFGKNGPGTIIVTEEGPNAINVVERGSPDGPTPQEGEDMDKFLARRDEKAIERARQLADIYFELEQELKEEGFPMVGIETYIDEQIAPGSSLTSDKPMDSPGPKEIAFEEQLKLRAKRN